jgi:hypothetical protein
MPSTIASLVGKQMVVSLRPLSQAPEVAVRVAVMVAYEA